MHAGSTVHAWKKYKKIFFIGSRRGPRSLLDEEKKKHNPTEINPTLSVWLWMNCLRSDDQSPWLTAFVFPPIPQSNPELCHWRPPHERTSNLPLFLLRTHPPFIYLRLCLCILIHPTLTHLTPPPFLFGVFWFLEELGVRGEGWGVEVVLVCFWWFQDDG